MLEAFALERPTSMSFCFVLLVFIRKDDVGLKLTVRLTSLSFFK